MPARHHLLLSFVLAAGFLAIAAAPRAATPHGEAPATGLRAIGRAYDRLYDALGDSVGDARDPAARARIATAARDFQDALRRDGGARPGLTADARDIIASLEDGTFSAARSLAVLRRDARGSLVAAGAWRPPQEGDPVPGSIGRVMNQRNEGDCVGISVIKAFSATPTGQAILRKIVTRNADGSFNVSFPGDSSTAYRLGPDGLDQYGKGDPAAAAVVGAMFRYFGLDPAQGALPTNKVMELLAGRLGDHDRLADAELTPAGIDEFLRRAAPSVGVQTAMVFGGKPGRDGEWTRGDGHAFAVIAIDAASGVVTYTNPWNEGQVRTIGIDALAAQAAGTSADFETVTFR
ncbi:hypothetical protein [Inquilinus sp.]|jgi:hypothetical protein|uniref:hypothetical protein n=1 Tax=Inquilinus sp. TaxID=1932117 RepID=UPI0037840BC1